MAFPSATISFPSRSLFTFHQHLKLSKRIVALLGADLSETADFDALHEGADVLGRNKNPTPEALQQSSDLARDFVHGLRQRAFEAEPNEGHIALAKLAKKKGRDGFFALSMNINGLYSRAGLPAEQNIELRGTLHDLQCGSRICGYYGKGDTETHYSTTGSFAPGADQTTLQLGELPKCPRCEIALLQPAILPFGKALPNEMVAIADNYIHDLDHIDLMLVVGTTASIWPAARYVEATVGKGARVALVTTERSDITPEVNGLYLTDSDWCFVGHASKLVPMLLEPLVDEFADVEEWRQY